MLKARYILISPPSVGVLKDRIAKRDQLDPNDPNINQWVEKAKSGQFNESDFDLVVVNDDLEKAYKKLKEYCISNYWADFESED
jgi:guanylate kinase